MPRLYLALAIVLVLVIVAAIVVVAKRSKASLQSKAKFGDRPQAYRAQPRMKYASPVYSAFADKKPLGKYCAALCDNDPNCTGFATDSEQQLCSFSWGQAPVPGSATETVFIPQGAKNSAAKRSYAIYQDTAMVTTGGKPAAVAVGIGWGDAGAATGDYCMNFCDGTPGCRAAAWANSDDGPVCSLYTDPAAVALKGSLQGQTVAVVASDKLSGSRSAVMGEGRPVMGVGAGGCGTGR